MSDNMDDLWCDYYEWVDEESGRSIAEEEVEMTNRIKNREWVTRTGKRLKIADMETSHIINCLRIINRAQWCYAYEYTKLFEAELNKRGVKEWV